MSDATALPAEGFPDLASLRAAHLAMLDRQTSAAVRQVPLDAGEVQAFRLSAVATGAVLARREDRSAAQRIVDYWSADLLASGRTETTDTETLPLTPLSQSGTGLDPAEGPQAEAPGDARDYIRFAAIGRQWRDRRSIGYLLSGDALARARQFVRDPDIAALVAASDRANLRWSWIKNGVVVALAVLAIAAGMFALDARQSAKTARDEAAEVTAQMAERARTATDLRAALDESAERQTRLEGERKAAQDRFAELAARQRQIDVAVAALADQIARGRATMGDIPEEIRPEVLANLAARWRQDLIRPASIEPGAVGAIEAEPAVDLPPLLGFQDGALGPDLPFSVLPRLGAPLVGRAHAQGAPVNYRNYSLVLDATRRYATFAAAHLDRSRRVVLPASAVPFEPDPRLPRDVQPDPDWLRQGRDGQGHSIVELVGRDDIAWGTAAEDGPLLDRLIRLYPNAVPVPADVASGWQAVSAWVQTSHNPAASQVVILSGPLFDDPPSAGGTAIALWKIAISVRDLPQQKTPGGPALVVDAFVVEGAAPDGQPVEGYRATVAAIAARSGLVFPAEVLAADRPVLGTSPGDRLARAVPGLDGPDAKARIELAEEIVSWIADADPGDQAKVAGALIDRLKDARRLSATGRLNVAVVLAAVPRSSWDRPDWRPLRAAATGAVADLDARQALGETAIGPKTRSHLDRLRSSLDAGLRQPQTVYLQFADLTRDRARTLRSALDRLGWQLPGEERVETATGLREVRYNPARPEDAAAAALLAADLAALGWTGARAVPLTLIREGVLEIWVGYP